MRGADRFSKLVTGLMIKVNQFITIPQCSVIQIENTTGRYKYAESQTLNKNKSNKIILLDKIPLYQACSPILGAPPLQSMRSKYLKTSS